jgi:hypothetical protein
MSEPTVTLRFPRRLHTDAKVAAAKRRMSLQSFVEAAVAKAMNSTEKPPGGVEGRLAKLPESSQKLVADFIGVMELAPEFYITAIQKYVSGMLALFRKLNKTVLAEADKKIR